jgi:hypothetical protein
MDTTLEMNLSIPVKSIYEEFFCPICYEIIKECTMTPCSHNFCKVCISESLNRKKKCPICNTNIVATQLVTNKQFDRLIGIIQQEKDVASKAYFDQLISGKIQPDAITSTNSTHSTQLSPIEQIFQNHMKRSLSSYEQYYQSIKAKYDTEANNVKSEFAKKMLDHQSQNQKSLQFTNDEQIQIWKKECDIRIENIEKGLQESTQLLLESYNEYMKNFAPAPEYLPVSLTIQIPSKNVQFPNIMINPTDTAAQVRNKVMEKMEKKGDPIMAFDDSNVMVIVSASDKKETVIQSLNVPIVQYRPEPGSVLVIQGKLLCKSDTPKECFKNAFIKDAGMRMDYFTCKKCKLNWLCKSCAETCHTDHGITEYIANHLPTWGCCYCPKTGNCKLVKKS